MQKKVFLLAFAAVALLLGAAVAGSMFWGSFSYSSKYPEISLKEFDKKTVAGEKNCFLLEVRSNYGRKTIMPYFVVSNGLVVLRKELDLGESQAISECIPAANFSQGDNFIEIYAGGSRLFYHTELLQEVPARLEPILSVSFDGKDSVNVRVENSDDLSYAPLEVFVNGRLDHGLYFSGSSFESNEKVSLQDGQNEIRVEFKGIAAATTAERKPKFGMSPAIGIALVSALLCVLAFLVFAKQPLLEKTAYSILSFFSVLMAVFFLFELAGMLSALNLAVAIASATIAIAIIFRRNLKGNAGLGIGQLKEIKRASPLLFILLGLLVFSSLFFNLFTSSYYSAWTSFYERQSAAIAGQQAVPAIDEFSFFGTKPFGYVSGYFFVNAGISLLAGLSTQQSYAMIAILAQAALIASALLFFSSFGFKGSRAYLAVLAFFLSGFVFADFIFNIRHVISYALLLLAVFFVRKEKLLWASLCLGFGTFVQTPVFLMFIALLPISLTKRETIKTALLSTLLGGFFALLLFAPTLLKSGIPTQAEYNVWGYMWGVPLYGFLLDYISMIVLIAFFILPFVLLKESRFGGFSARVAAFLALFALVQIFVSYRINVVVTVAFALLVAQLFPKRILDNRASEYCLSVLFAIAFALMFILMASFHPVEPIVQSSFNFVRLNTSTNANFLNDPYLGHSFIFLAQRKSSADLAVEYANSEMILDSFEFIKTGNRGILEKHGIDYVVNRSIFLNERPVGDNLWHKLLEFERLDKVYANGIMFVHWVDRGRA